MGNAQRRGLDPVPRYIPEAEAMTETKATLTLGAVAASAGVNRQTVRYYERRGLLPAPPRTAANYRAYAAGAVQRVRFIKRAQALGFTLREVAELIALHEAPHGRCADVRARAQAKVRAIEAKVRALQAMRRSLAALVADCPDTPPASRCPILENLATPP